MYVHVHLIPFRKATLQPLNLSLGWCVSLSVPEETRSHTQGPFPPLAATRPACPRACAT